MQVVYFKKTDLDRKIVQDVCFSFRRQIVLHYVFQLNLPKSAASLKITTPNGLTSQIFPPHTVDGRNPVDR